MSEGDEKIAEAFASSEITDRQGRKWKRLGSCSRCGNCCRYLRFGFREADIYPKEFEEFYGVRDVKIFESEFEKGIRIVLVPNVCPHLGGDNLCKMQKDKPLSCRLQPVGPESNEGFECSFRWKEIHEEGRTL